MIRGNDVFKFFFLWYNKEKELKNKNRKAKEISLTLTCEIQYHKLITINYMATDKKFIRVKINKQSCIS